MKKLLFFIIAAFLLMLVFPKTALSGAEYGLSLWFNKILPTLLPFLIISNLIYRLRLDQYINKVLFPLFKYTLKIPKSACYAVFMGCLSGIPVGAGLTSLLVKDKKISQKEGQYVLLLCNNPSISFMLNYVLGFCDGICIPVAIIIIFTAPFLAAVIYCRCHPSESPFATSSSDSPMSVNCSLHSLSNDTVSMSLGETFDKSIMNAFETITRVGGYIIIFSIAASFISLLSGSIPALRSSPKTGIISGIISGIFEITSGIGIIGSMEELSCDIKSVILPALASFGGLSGILQTRGQLVGTGLSCRKYIKGRLLSCLITILMTTLYLLFNGSST